MGNSTSRSQRAWEAAARVRFPSRSPLRYVTRQTEARCMCLRFREHPIELRALENDPQSEIDLARPGLAQQRAGLAADDAYRPGRADIGCRGAEARVIQGIRHDHAEPHREAFAIFEILQQPEVQVANRGSVENVQSGVAEPAYRRRIAAYRIGCRAARNRKSGLIEKVAD